MRLFADEATEETFFVPVGAGEPFVRSLVTNADTENLVFDSEAELDRVEVQLYGASEDPDVERIEVSSPGAIVQRDAAQHYSFRLGAGLATVGNFSSLLATLTYVSNLTVSALTQPPRNLTITAYDDVGAGEPIVGFIALVELNAEGPQFEFPAGETSYSATVDERSLPGTLVTNQISATDPGGDSVTYSFVDPIDAFEIDPLTGVVQVNNSDSDILDHETTTQVTLTVAATDNHPINSLSTLATLVVNINNINDNPPTFTQDLYTFDVFDDELNARVGTVNATDLDGTNVNTLLYDFVDPNTQQFFVINENTGEIIVRTTLDYEDPMFDEGDPRVLTFEVQVYDGISFDYATVQVNIVDLPDRRPVIRPTEKLITLNLDDGESSTFLTAGTGGTLTVTDDSNFDADAFLVGGNATYSVLRDDQVRHS